MAGFFSKQETMSEMRPAGKMLSCISCAAYKTCQNGRMKPYGNFEKEIMIIGGSPDRIDDQTGLPFQGEAGQLLERTLGGLGIDLFNDCISLNSTNCRIVGKDGKDREPTNYEVECCRKFKINAIAEYKPKLIILLGNSAVFSLIGHRWKKDLGKIDKWRGWTIPDQDFKAWVCPTFDPSFVLANEKKDQVATIWELDLKQAISKLKIGIPIYREPTIDIVSDLSKLSAMKRMKVVAFDYETTGLKPHAEGHQIVCASVAYSHSGVIGFMMPKNQRDRRPFVHMIADPQVGKMAHNMKFEETWSAVRLRQPVQNWAWDSMIAAHVLDNRVGVTGLKFQTYVQFGIVDYDSAISPYLKAVDDSNANSLNRILELISTPEGKEKLLRYCCYDSINEYRLAMIQREIILPF